MKLTEIFVYIFLGLVVLILIPTIAFLVHLISNFLKSLNKGDVKK